MMHIQTRSRLACFQTAFAVALGLLGALAVLFALDPALLSVAWARPLGNTLTVTTFNDTGAGSLRDTLGAAGAAIASTLVCLPTR